MEMVLRLSAERIAGPPHPGKKGGTISWHGGEKGTVCLKERKLRVKRPRLRKKGQGEDGEVRIPAYEVMRSDGKLGGRMLEILLRGVSTRQYRAVLPDMAETVGVSRSSVSREAMEASEEELKRLCERRLEELELLILYLDGELLSELLVGRHCGVEWLKAGVPIEEASRLLGHSSIKTAERHCNPWVQSRQERLDSPVLATCS